MANRITIFTQLVVGLLCVASDAWAAPGNVSGATAIATSPYAITVSWDEYTGADFGTYEVRRATAANVTRSASLVASIADSSATTARDSNLVAYTTYHYRVFVVSPTDTASSGVEVSARTSQLSFPFADTVGATNRNFTPGGTWAIVPNGELEGDAYSGGYHWTDSPGGNYAASTSASLTMTINLPTGTTAPALLFWQRYSFYPNDDWGRVEVSTNGGASWTQEYFVTGSSASWRQERIDLSPYRGNSEVMIRFRLASNAANHSDGWHLDDIQIADISRQFAYPFADSFDDTTSAANWLTSSWEYVTGSHTTPYGLHDSPIGPYSIDAFTSATLAGTIDLRGATNPVLSFWHKHDLYTYHYYHNQDDYARVYVSPDNGAVWYSMAYWTGSLTTWTKVAIDLRQFVGASAVRVRFTLDDNPNLDNTAQNSQTDGWWIDDVRVEELPVDVGLSIVSNSMHQVALAWTANADADFAQYEIYRATSASVTRSSTLIKTITNQGTTTFTDSVAMIQPTQYSYRIYVVDSLANVSLGSNVVTATYTVPVNTFPFLDSMDAETTQWAWGTPWGPTTATYHSAPTSWAESPGASYPANANTALATYVNLSGSTEPVLTFWHRYSFETAADFGRVEVSADAGQTWTEVLRVTGIDTNWTSERIDLGKYVGATIGVRFRVTSSADTHLDGWYIDDVGISDGPRMIAFPWTDGVESGVNSWFASSPWGLSGENSHSGTWHWTDSPEGSYAPNENTSLRITIDLSGSDAPMLRFWERYSFEPNADWGFVEVSTNNGTSWTMEYALTGSSSEWRQDEIDLSPYRGNPQVMIRFRVQSNASNESDGWHLDDFEIVDLARVVPYPFVDNFDDSTSAANWLTSSWEYSTGGYSAPYRMNDSPDGNYAKDAFSSLVLAGTMDLRGATNPVLTFWHYYDLYTYHYYHNQDDYGRVYVSPDNGAVWYLMGSWTGSQTTWAKVTISLSQFAGASHVRVRFTLDDNPNLDNTAQNSQSNGWWIDDVRVEELPVPVAVSPIESSSQHHASLSWTRNNDGDFARYEVYRATSTTIDRTSPLVTTITDQAVTAWTDTFAAVQPTQYSYRMYVVDVLGNVSPGSNVVTAGYAIPLSEFPFADSMNTEGANWSWGTPWGPATNSFHTAPTSWKSGPGRAYPSNANTALATQVSLAGATSPVLTFWHRYAFEAGADFGRVEVSADGGQTWAEVLRVTGIDTSWSSERVDLGKYLGSTIGLRFRVTSSAETNLDGWYVDDVRIEDGPRMASFPWSDDVESGVKSWFANSPWGLSNVGSHSGEWHWTDSPAGSYAPNENTSLTIAVDLSGAEAPVLAFWERYSFEPSADWGFVEVSTNVGQSWTQELFVTGSEASWRKESVDLSPYAGNPSVMIRFRLQSNGSQESDGWHLDDFSVTDLHRQFAYPFADGFDDSTSRTNWLNSSWEYMTGGRSSPYLMHDSPLGVYPINAFTSMVMAGTIDLRGAINPVLTFWHKYDLYTNHSYWNEDDYGRVYVSPDNGQVWYLLQSWTGSLTTWTKVSIGLSQFVGASAVRVRFTLDDNPNLNNTAQNNTLSGWWLDDVRLGENLALAALGDSVRYEGPAVVQAAPGLASPRLIGRVYEPSVTNLAGQGVNVRGQFGVGPLGSMPNDTTWTWFAGGYLDDASNFDRFYGSVRVDTVGTYSLAFRASIDNGATWVYGDLDGNNLAGGGVSEFEASKAGLLIVGLGGTVVLSDDSLHREVRLGQQEIWSIGVGNDGPDPLYWKLFEANAASVVGDVSWMVVQKPTGVLANGARERVDLTFDATGLVVDSTYRARLLLTSNDHVNDSLWVGISLTVLPADASGFTGWVSMRGGGRVAGGQIILYDAEDAPVDTIDVALNGWFAAYGVTSGTYRVVVNVPGAYPQEFVNVALPSESMTILMSPIHPLVSSPFFMNLYSDASTLDGVPLPVGSVVTVRDPDGIVVGGFIVHTEGRYGTMHVYADDPNTPADEGARVGDVLGIFVNDVKVNTSLTYENHNVVERVDVAANTATPRHLGAGLHLISLAVTPRDTALQTVLLPISGKYSYVAGFDQAWGGARTYVDSLEAQGFNDLHGLDGFHGYWLRMDEPGDLVVYGSRLHDDVPIPVKTGWNLISYLPAIPFGPDRALASIRSLITIAGGFDAGAKTYVPGSPLSDLVEMNPGFGYWLHVSAPAHLNYRAGASVGAPMARPSMPEIAYLPSGQPGQPIPTREWMDLYGMLLLDGRPVEAGTVVSIADRDGVFCGTTVVRMDGQYGFLHTYADDRLTETDEGALPGESLALFIGGERVYTRQALTWQGSKTVVRMDLAASLVPTGVGSTRPLRFALEPAHPNPFNPRTVIRYEVSLDGPATVVVYDQLGRRVRTLADGFMPAGRHAITWDAADDLGRTVASGVYFVRLASEEGTITRRVTLLR